MKTIKGFDNNLKCRDFQYEIGKTYEQNGEIKACENGFHAIDEDSAPLSVFNYYPPTDERGKLSCYCEVEAEGEIDRLEDKVACSKITIGAEIGLPGIIKAHIEWVKKHITSENKESNTGDYSAAMNTGGYSAATNTGNYSVAMNTGYCSAATNIGDYSAATNTGNYSAAMNTGYCSVATNTGNCSVACVEGKDSVAMATGFESKAKGALGCAIVVVERGEWNGETYPLKSICSAIVDGVKIKADTWYTVKNGKFVEVED